MITPEDLAQYTLKVAQGIRNKEKRGSISRDDVADLLDDLAALAAASGPVLLKIRAADLTLNGTTYDNPELQGPIYSLEMTGVGPLREGVHYELLLAPQRGFRLLGLIDLGPTDYITLTGTLLLSSAPGSDPELRALILSAQGQLDALELELDDTIQTITPYLVNKTVSVLPPTGVPEQGEEWIIYAV